LGRVQSNGVELRPKFLPQLNPPESEPDGAAMSAMRAVAPQERGLEGRTVCRWGVKAGRK
jgi:hypothetical protein